MLTRPPSNESRHINPPSNTPVQNRGDDKKTKIKKGNKIRKIESKDDKETETALGKFVGGAGEGGGGLPKESQQEWERRRICGVCVFVGV